MNAEQWLKAFDGQVLTDEVANKCDDWLGWYPVVDATTMEITGLYDLSIGEEYDRQYSVVNSEYAVEC